MVVGLSCIEGTLSTEGISSNDWDKEEVSKDVSTSSSNAGH